MLYPFTTNHGLPTALTFHTAGHDFSDAWDAFRVVKAPTPALRGFLLTAAIALWVTTFVSDWAAFRLWVPFETIIPSGTLFLFASMFGTDTRRTLYALIYAIAVPPLRDTLRGLVARLPSRHGSYRELIETGRDT